MFLNVTVAIRHIDRQSHVTLCHAARHSCSIAPTRFPLDNGLQSRTRKQESHLTQRLMDAERLKNAYETTRNGEEGKAYAAWGRSIRSEGRIRPVSQPLPIKPRKLLVCGPGVISSPSYGMPCDTSSRSRLIDGLYRGSPPALYQTRKSTELLICPALTVSIALILNPSGF